MVIALAKISGDIYMVKLVVFSGVRAPVEDWHSNDDHECWLGSIGQVRANERYIYAYVNKLAFDGVLLCQRLEKEKSDSLGALQSLTKVPGVGSLYIPHLTRRRIS